MEIELLLPGAKQIGEQLTRPLPVRVIRDIAERLVLEKLRVLRVEPLLDLFEEPGHSKASGFEELVEVRFFFMRWSIRLPSTAADSLVTSGLISRYASVSDFPRT